jgi:alkylation response protein AidB-like acyl-CoA dehydrogenase
MAFRWEPVTQLGQRFVDTAENHARDFAGRAAAHDRDGTFPHENFDELKASGFMAATVPEEFGGWGLTSNHDLAVGISRIAGADGSTAIAATMHLTFGQIGAWFNRYQRETGDEAGAAGTAGFLTLLGGGAIGMANATEPGTDLRHPLTEVTSTEGGCAINGRKTFGTLSEIADLMFVPSRRAEPDGSYRSVAAFVPRGTPGQTIKDNWDALGMRASGSHDVVYDNCVVPEELVLDNGTAWGEDGLINVVIGFAGNLPLVATSVGIAAAAYDEVLRQVKTRTKAPSGRPLAERRGIQHLVAQMEADLVTCRALLSHAGRHIDQAMARPANEVDLDVMHDIGREFQCVKLVANRKAIDIVDTALTASGGAGYMTSSPLSRLYRDVRAGPFMQPYSPVDAHEYIGKLALGLPPDIDD